MCIVWKSKRHADTKHKVKRFVLAASLFFAFATVAHAEETVNLLSQCPFEGENAACLLVFIGGDETLNVGGAVSESVAEYMIRGRLGDGPAQDFRVRVRDEAHVFRGLDLGQTAYLGRSLANRPIVLSDRGPFEILTSGLDPLAFPAVVVVDRKSERVTDQFLPFERGRIHARAGGNLFAWDSERDVCVSAPRWKPGRLTFEVGQCASQAQPKEFFPYFAGDIETNSTAARLKEPRGLNHHGLKEVFFEVRDYNRVAGSDLMIGFIQAYDDGETCDC